MQRRDDDTPDLPWRAGFAPIIQHFQQYAFRSHVMMRVQRTAQCHDADFLGAVGVDAVSPVRRLAERALFGR